MNEILRIKKCTLKGKFNLGKKCISVKIEIGLSIRFDFCQSSFASHQIRFYLDKNIGDAI